MNTIDYATIALFLVKFSIPHHFIPGHFVELVNLQHFDLIDACYMQLNKKNSNNKALSNYLYLIPVDIN